MSTNKNGRSRWWYMIAILTLLLVIGVTASGTFASAPAGIPTGQTTGAKAQNPAVTEMRAAPGTKSDTKASSPLLPYGWVGVASLPTATHRHAVASDGTYLYSIGGETTGGVFLSAMQRYDPAANSYTAMASMPAGRSN